MNVLRMLRDKPWLHAAEAATVAQYGGPDPVAAMRVMLRFILAIVGVIFLSGAGSGILGIRPRAVAS